MNTYELSQMIGRKAHWTIFDLQIPVKITDARHVFGRTDIQIQPLFGEGKHWCSHRAVDIIDDKDAG